MTAMGMKVRAALAGASLVAGCFSAAALSADGGTGDYRVSMTIYDGDRIVGEPTLDVRSGEPAKIAIEPGDGSYYRATVSVAPQAKVKFRLTSHFDVSSATLGTQSADPLLDVLPGEAGTIEFGERTAEHRPFRAVVHIDRIVS